jgi:hypothetical protein
MKVGKSQPTMKFQSELAEFFKRAQAESRKGAQQGKEKLAKRLSS